MLARRLDRGKDDGVWWIGHDVSIRFHVKTGGLQAGDRRGCQAGGEKSRIDDEQGTLCLREAFPYQVAEAVRGSAGRHEMRHGTEGEIVHGISIDGDPQAYTRQCRVFFRTMSSSS